MKSADNNAQLQRMLQLMTREAERNQAVLKSFFEMEIRLLGCTELSELLDLILIEFKEHFRLTCVNLVLFDPENAARDLLDDYIPPAPGHALRFVSNQRLLSEIFPAQKLLVGELRCEQKRLAFPSSPFILSCALLPLIRHNCLIGSLHLGSSDATRYSKHLDYDYISHMASVIAVCIENCINQQNLKRLSIIDMLTKVHNRRAFDQEISRELSRANRADHPLCCLFVDLDHFKLVNDNYGHQTGDNVLRTVGLLLKQLLRKTDFVARYGGEEFAILLTNCEGSRALQIAETIRERILTMIVHADNGNPFRISASIGVSCCHPGKYDHSSLDDLAQQLLKTADQCVYQAKKSGRNCCVLSPMGTNSSAGRRTA